VQLSTCANIDFKFLIQKMPPKPYIILLYICIRTSSHMYIYGLSINVSKFYVVCTCLWSLYLVPLFNMCSSSEVMLFQVFETFEIKKFSNLNICNRVGTTYNMKAQMVYELFVDMYGCWVPSHSSDMERRMHLLRTSFSISK
jgi:hypothetical protein